MMLQYHRVDSFLISWYKTCKNTLLKALHHKPLYGSPSNNWYSVVASVLKQAICLQIEIEVLLPLLNVTIQHELLLVKHAFLLSNLLVLIDIVNMASQ
jgi:hypothetical protein